MSAPGRAASQVEYCLRLHTQRLDLVACTPEVARAALLNGQGMGSLIQAGPAEEWPLQGLRGFLPFYIADLERDPSLLGWGAWLLVQAEERLIIGDAGFHGMPARDGSVELGYSVVPAYRRLGYCSEAVRAMLGWAFSHWRVKRVTATCEADNAASSGLLAKLGMRQVGASRGSLKWEILRENWRWPATTLA